jgi:hypothetical protein
VDGIDLMLKEQRKSLRVAKSELATQLEKQQQAWNVHLSNSDEHTVVPEHSRHGMANELDATWYLQASEDAVETPQQVQSNWPGHSIPMRSQVSLREVMAQGKKALSREESEKRKCKYCLRKGRTRETCIIRPIELSERYPARTELQRKKQTFVLGLIARTKAPEI